MAGIPPGTGLGHGPGSSMREELYSDPSSRGVGKLKPKAIAEAIDNDKDSSVVLEKSNILMLGPTGSGTAP